MSMEKALKESKYTNLETIFPNSLAPVCTTHFSFKISQSFLTLKIFHTCGYVTGTISQYCCTHKNVTYVIQTVQGT